MVAICPSSLVGGTSPICPYCRISDFTLGLNRVGIEVYMALSCRLICKICALDAVAPCIFEFTDLLVFPGFFFRTSSLDEIRDEYVRVAAFS